MRQVFPDWANAELIEITPDDRGVVRLDGGEKITIFFPPTGASAVGKGARGRIQFVRRGNKQTPQWRTCCEKNGKRDAIVVIAHWPSYRNGPTRKNCAEGLYDEVSEPTSVQSFPLFIRIWEDSIYEYGGSTGGNANVGSPWQLNGAEVYERWIDFLVDEEGILAQVSGYGSPINGDVKFDGQPDPEYSIPQFLEQRIFDREVPAWQWYPPSITETYTWTGDNNPPGSGGSGGGGGGF